jgi:hypothetical protein
MWLPGFAPKGAGVKPAPQKIKGCRFIRKTKNIENRASPTPRARNVGSCPAAGFGARARRPYKTRTAAKVVQVAF